MLNKCNECGRFIAPDKGCLKCDNKQSLNQQILHEQPKTVDTMISEDTELFKVQDSYSSLKSKYKRALEKLSITENSLKAALRISDSQKIEDTVCTVGDSVKSDAIPIILWSDWHPGELVDPKTVNAVNEYNPDIFRKRADALFLETYKILDMLRQRMSIDTLVIWLGGDLITGYIHAELMESNTLSPTEEVLLAQEVIAKGIRYLLDTANIKRLIIPCNFGNHGRTGEKIKVSTGHLNSFEWLMYHSLALLFSDDPRVEFHISDGHVLYLELWDKVLRFTHGDAIKYQGGIGGITIPLIKWIHRQDQVIKADMTFLGHFHTLQFHQSFTTNSSLIGPTAYGLRIGFPPEPAQQALVLLERERGFTLRCPILANKI